jgi:tetratricopeptide (TPR) repeat protein
VTRHTILLRLIIAALLAAILLVPITYFVHGWQRRCMAKTLLERAQAEQSAERWLVAAGYLDRYLQIHPRDAVILRQLATVYAQGAVSPAEKRRAIQLHYRAVASEPQQHDADRLRARLAALLLETGRFYEAERAARQLVAADPHDPFANRALALALFAQWQNGSLAAVNPRDLKILTTMEKACRLNPTDVLLAESAATIYRNHPKLVAVEFPEASGSDRQKKADAYLDELVEQSDTQPKAYLARYRWRQQTDSVAARADLDKALELGPQDSEVLLEAAAAIYRDAQQAKLRGDDLASAREQFVTAGRYYEQLIERKQLPPNPEPWIGLGEVLADLGELDEALNVWTEGLKKFTEPRLQIRFQTCIADALLAADRGNAIEDPLLAIDSIITKLEADLKRDERLVLIQAQGLRRASWLLQQGRPAEAVPLLHDIVARQACITANNAVTGRVWNLMGRASVMLGNWRQAAIAFDRLAGLEPSNDAPRLSSAYAWLQIGQPELALARAEQALLLETSAEGWLVLAAAEFQMQAERPAKQRSWKRFENAVHMLEQAPASKLSTIAEVGADLCQLFHVTAESHDGGDLGKKRSVLEAAIKRQSEREFLTRPKSRLLVKLKPTLDP